MIASIEQLGSDIANCAVAHRAALQMTFYHSPSSLPDLAELLRHPPTLINEATLRTLRKAQRRGPSDRTSNCPLWPIACSKRC